MQATVMSAKRNYSLLNWETKEKAFWKEEKGIKAVTVRGRVWWGDSS
jgi:hypothetical protein